MKELFLYKIPKHLCRNHLDEHKYLIWGLAFFMLALYGFCDMIGAPKGLSVAIPILYYVYLIYAIMEGDLFPYDLRKLKLNNEDFEFISSVTQVYKSRIGFYTSKMTKDKFKKMNSEDKKALAKRIYDALNSRDEFGVRVFMGRIHLFGGYIPSKDEDEIDPEFIDIFMKTLNPTIHTEDLKGLKALGVTF